MLPRIAQHATRAAARAAPRSVRFNSTFFWCYRFGIQNGYPGVFHNNISLAVLGYLGVNFAHMTRMILREPRGPDVTVGMVAYSQFK